MLRVIISAVIGAILIFLWGFLSWAVVGMYDFAFPEIDNEQAMRITLNETFLESGAYVFPQPPSDMSDEEAVTQWQTRHTTGPLGMILLNKEGADPMSPILMLRGFGIEFLAALILSMLLWWARIDTYGGRMSFIFFATVFAVVTTHAVHWNFFYLPAEYTFALMIDPVIGWLIAGFAMAAILKPKLWTEAVVVIPADPER